jgi:hypothetical protein
MLVLSNANLLEVNILNCKHDKRISFSIIIQLCMLITNYTIKELFAIENTSLRELMSLFFMLLVGLIFLINLPIVLKRIGRLFFFTYLMFGMLFTLNLFFYKNVGYILEVSFWFFLICLPTGLFYVAIKNKKIFLNMLIKSAYYQIIVALLFFISSILKTSLFNYDMVFSYLILVPIIILLYKCIFNGIKLLDILLIFAGLVSIITIGSRGPILSIIIFSMISILIFFFENRSKFKSLIFFFLLGTGFIIFISTLNSLLFSFEKLLARFGIQSRFITLFTSEKIDFLTGRSDIYQLTIQNIMDNPLFGLGLAGDRVLLKGTYPHNIFLEIVSQFGIVIGSIILIIFLFYWIAGPIYSNKSERDLIVIFLGIGLVQLFVSGSYLTSSNFWLLMGACFSSLHIKSSSY